MIKPDFFGSESMSNVRIGARLAFIGLWVLADDNGNLKAGVHRIRRQLFPDDDMQDIDVEIMLAQLERERCIKYYEVDGEGYIHVCNFEVYQRINRPSKTTIPTPSKELENISTTKRFSEHSLIIHGALNESLFTEHSLQTHSKEVSKEVSNSLSPKGLERVTTGCNSDEPDLASADDESSEAMDVHGLIERLSRKFGGQNS